MLRRLFRWIFKEWIEQVEQVAKDRERLASLQIQDAGKLIDDAKQAMEAATHLGQLRNYTTLKVFNVNSEEFLTDLTDVIESEAFLYFMHLQSMSTLAGITDGDAKAALYGQGVMKGLDLVMRKLHDARNAYLALKAEQDISNAEV